MAGLSRRAALPARRTAEKAFQSHRQEAMHHFDQSHNDNLALPTLTGQTLSVILSRPKGGEESLSYEVETLSREAAKGDKCPIIPSKSGEPSFTD
jgi:hypothetical protein